MSPGRLPGGCHFRLLSSLRDRLRKGIRMLVRGWSRGGLDDLPPHTTWFQPSPTPICSLEGLARWAFGAVTLFRLPSGACFSIASFASFHFTPHANSQCGFPAARALRLFSRGRESAGLMGAPQAKQMSAYIQLRCVSTKRWYGLHCMGSFSRHVRYHRHWQTAEFGEISHYVQPRHSPH